MHNTASLYEQRLDPAMVDAYLSRIGYDGPRDGSATALAQIQQQHLLRVPFENLDILRGTALSLAVSDLFDKIVTRRRGGFCFELNGLFGYLLRALGYEVTDFTARFMLGHDQPVMRRHRMLKVLAQGQYYLCDVGTGVAIPRLPLRMRLGMVQQQPFGAYQLLWDDFYGWELFEQHKGRWRLLYTFTEEPQLDLDFEATCYYCERHPDSIFNKAPMLSIRTPTGRVTIDGHDLRIFDGDTVDTYVLPSGGDFHAALEKYFGIELAHNP